MSFINSEVLFHEFNGSDQSGFTALHSPVQHSPDGTPYVVQSGVDVLAQPQFNLAALPGFLAHYFIDNF